MADKMVVYGLRHKRNRLAGEITTLETRNHENNRKIEVLQARVAENLAKIATCRSQIDTLKDAALLGFATNLPAAISRQTYPKHHFVEWGEATRASLSTTRVVSPPAPDPNNFESAAPPSRKLFYVFSQGSIWDRSSLSDLLRLLHFQAPS